MKSAFEFWLFYTNNFSYFVYCKIGAKAYNRIVIPKREFQKKKIEKEKKKMTITKEIYSFDDLELSSGAEDTLAYLSEDEKETVFNLMEEEFCGEAEENDEENEEDKKD